MGTLTIMIAGDFGQLKTSETEDFELVNGELIPWSSGTPLHAKMRRRLDVSIFLKERLQGMDWNKIPVPFAPDIAVEILSPSESAIDVHRKVREYLAAGTQEVWIMDHVNAELFVHSHAGIRLLLETDVLASPLLTGFAAQVAELFGGLSEAAPI